MTGDLADIGLQYLLFRSFSGILNVSVLDGDLINMELFIIGFHFNSVNMEIDGTFST